MPIGHLLGQNLDVCLQQGEIDLLRPTSKVFALLCKTAVIIEIHVPYITDYNTRVLTSQTTVAVPRGRSSPPIFAKIL